MNRKDPIVWSNIQVRIGDLKPWAQNPKSISRKRAERLGESWDEFGQVETVAVGPGLEVYNGHQRLNYLKDKFGPDFVIDARQSSRALTEKERRKLTIFLHTGTVGEYDLDILSGWGDPDIVKWGLDQEFVNLSRVESSFVAGMLGIQKFGVFDFSELDKQNENLEGLEDRRIWIVIPARVFDQVVEWLANGEQLTGPGLGKGVMKRCGLL